jgi:hypothetical protein
VGKIIYVAHLQMNLKTASMLTVNFHFHQNYELGIVTSGVRSLAT